MDRRSFLQLGGLATASVLVGAAPAPRRPVGDVTAQVLGAVPLGSRAGDARLSEVVEPRPFSALALGLPTLASGAWVRTRAGTAWSAWAWLPAAAADHGPDGGAADPVTELHWASMADAFQVAAPTADGVGEVTPHVVDSLGWPVGTTGDPVDDILDTVRGLLPGEDEEDKEDEPSAPPRPAIASRRRWGADESWRSGTIEYARPRRALLHHTATSNDYTRSEAPGIVRAIYHYHAHVRGWNDIGYNFLVDRFGRIYEGRAGGVRKGVVGAHARGHNTGSVGVAVIGNLQSSHPPAGIRRATADLLAWKYHRHGIPPGPNQRISHGSRSYPVLAGHRDTGSTACPGQRLFDHLPEIRGGIERRF